VETLSCRAYITDALKVIVENTSKAPVLGVGIVDYGTILSNSWYDLIQPKEKEEIPKDTRSCQEITQDIFKRIRGEMN